MVYVYQLQEFLDHAWCEKNRLSNQILKWTVKTGYNPFRRGASVRQMGIMGGQNNCKHGALCLASVQGKLAADG